jgi:hypothetical protein
MLYAMASSPVENNSQSKKRSGKQAALAGR